ncbi:T9SS type A sorting domain-containing protein [Brumimicrobium aurantiacum]|uniref:T9SS C-terminal target domain-containing protein n=1 Tax=Brumimicrobium aurantiacum TaxID=1737063 RepID=A0A3E1EU84_9FLAO|nr:T9SS type A sorting domain-containing protein [Brumimicrobium aurantiacum]RFC53090.1 T9SS C-terminal target domain-containing protein [Brumimicrobium aurantiacum]
MIINENNIMLKLCYPELWVKESLQNRPVIWFVAKREGNYGMLQNNNKEEDTLVALSKELFVSEQDSMPQELKLNVYPNPFEDYFIVESPVEDEMVVQDPSGRVVLQQSVSKGENRIRTQELTSGIYFVRFINQNKTFKIIKR